MIGSINKALWPIATVAAIVSCDIAFWHGDYLESLELGATAIAMAYLYPRMFND